jgi:hypothetical protein
LDKLRIVQHEIQQDEVHYNNLQIKNRPLWNTTRWTYNQNIKFQIKKYTELFTKLHKWIISKWDFKV